MLTPMRSLEVTVDVSGATGLAPVLVACGERDVVPDPEGERAAYPLSPEVRIIAVPRMAHMHNFAATRAVLCRAIDEFARAVKGRIRR